MSTPVVTVVTVWCPPRPRHRACRTGPGRRPGQGSAVTRREREPGRTSHPRPLDFRRGHIHVSGPAGRRREGRCLPLPPTATTCMRALTESTSQKDRDACGRSPFSRGRHDSAAGGVLVQEWCESSCSEDTAHFGENGGSEAGGPVVPETVTRALGRADLLTRERADITRSRRRPRTGPGRRRRR